MVQISLCCLRIDSIANMSSPGGGRVKQGLLAGEDHLL